MKQRNNAWIRVRIFISGLLLGVIMLYGCKTQSDDIKSYGAWNDTTISILQNSFNRTLPEKKTVECYGVDYYYSFTEAFLGDPMFMIRVTLQFPSDNDVQSQLGTYVLDNSELMQDGTTIYCFLQGDAQKILEYMDDDICDGIFYDFEIISVDYETNRVTIVNARAWDYCKDPELCEYLGRCVNVTRGQTNY